VGAGVGAQALLRDYLINQVDDQLLSVVGGVAERLDRAGIADDGDEDSQRSAQAITPLNRVPTSTSVTVLDPFGNLIGGIGGDFNSNEITDYLKPTEVNHLLSKHLVQIFALQPRFCHLL
jgi:two-component system OmpR family sensor kinase